MKYNSEHPEEVEDSLKRLEEELRARQSAVDERRTKSLKKQKEERKRRLSKHPMDDRKNTKLFYD
jgi:hypothetical protein